jgi:hypothetical protein
VSSHGLEHVHGLHLGDLCEHFFVVDPLVMYIALRSESDFVLSGVPVLALL